MATLYKHGIECARYESENNIYSVRHTCVLYRAIGGGKWRILKSRLSGELRQMKVSRFLEVYAPRMKETYYLENAPIPHFSRVVNPVRAQYEFDTNGID